MSEEKDFDYEGDMKVDCDALDVEWVYQPKLYMKWAALSAQAEDEVRRAKENLKITDADIDKEVRDFSTKVTDSLIKAEIERSPDHQQAMVELNKALYNADICSSAVKGMDHKKHSLENEVKLWAGSYFAGPKEPRDIGHEIGIKEGFANRIEKKIREQTKERAGKISRTRTRGKESKNH